MLVSAGRDARPWRGETDAPPRAAPARHDPACELCPGVVRASGIRNPDYSGVFVFDNDFPALRPGRRATFRDGLWRAEVVSGTARVICFSPRHDLSLGTLTDAERRGVIDTWAAQGAELGMAYRWVQVFENRGAAMGASNPHPHGQVWAGTSLPSEPAREDRAQRRYLARTGRALLDDVAVQEGSGPRVVERGRAWLAVVPYWAAWPYETLIVPTLPVARLQDLDDAGRDDLAAVLGRLLRRYDALFDRPLPYSMGWHGAPGGRSSGRTPSNHWRLHGHVYPPLLRATARKFMVGYELLAESQRDLTPEEAADRLRAALGPVRRKRGSG